MKRSVWSAIFALVLAITALSAACGGSNPAGYTGGLGPDGGGSDDATLTSDAPTFNHPGDGSAFDANGALVITPGTVTIPVTIGQTPSIPTKQYSATFDGSP